MNGLVALGVICLPAPFSIFPIAAKKSQVSRGNIHIRFEAPARTPVMSFVSEKDKI